MWFRWISIGFYGFPCDFADLDGRHGNFTCSGDWNNALNFSSIPRALEAGPAANQGLRGCKKGTRVGHGQSCWLKISLKQTCQISSWMKSQHHGWWSIQHFPSWFSYTFARRQVELLQAGWTFQFHEIQSGSKIRFIASRICPGQKTTSKSVDGWPRWPIPPFGEDRGMCYGHFHAIPIVAGFFLPVFFEDYLTFLFILDLMWSMIHTLHAMIFLDPSLSIVIVTLR